MKKQNVRTLSFIVSTFTYLLIGAAIFDALESQTEENVKNELERIETDYKLRYNISHDEYRSFEDLVNRFHFYKTYPQWKFTGAFYFSLTVITTIGYGHSTPQTIPGKMFCMLYAIIGIPLCLIMFQSVGERLNHFASFCIQLVKKCLRFKKTEVNQTEMVCVAGIFAVFVITGGAAMFSHYEGWTYFNSIYYCVITLTTIGFGDFVALQQQDKNNLTNTTYVILSFTFILFGLTVVASSINLLVLKFLTMNTDDERREEYTRKVAMRSSGSGFLDFLGATAAAAGGAAGFGVGGSGGDKNQEPGSAGGADTMDTLSRSDYLNVLNGSVICMFEPTDLNDLRRENSIQFCSGALWRGIRRRVAFTSRFPFVTIVAESSENDDEAHSSSSAANKRREYDYDDGGYVPDEEETERLNPNPSLNRHQTSKMMTTSVSATNNAQPPPGLKTAYSIDSLIQSNSNLEPTFLSANKTIPVNCTSCCIIANTNNNNSNEPNMLLTTVRRRRKKKPHYTVRRAPGKISHLLLPNRLNSFTDVAQVKQSGHNANNLNKTGAKSGAQASKKTSMMTTTSSAINIPIKKDNNNDDDENDDNEHQIPKSSTLYDVNIYIDEEEDDDEEEDEDYDYECDEDCLTATNVTTLSILTNNANTKSSPATSQQRLIASTSQMMSDCDASETADVGANRSVASRPSTLSTANSSLPPSSSSHLRTTNKTGKSTTTPAAASATSPQTTTTDVGGEFVENSSSENNNELRQRFPTHVV